MLYSWVGLPYTFYFCRVVWRAHRKTNERDRGIDMIYKTERCRPI